MQTIEEIKELIHKVKTVLKTSYWFTPLNLKEERKKVFDDPSYNPQFIYPEVDKIILQKYLEQLTTAEVDNVEVLEKWILTRKIEELILKVRLNLFRGTEETAAISGALYQCEFTPYLFEKAHEELKNLRTDSNDSRRVEAIELKNIVEEYLYKNYSITDWKLEIVDSIAYNFRITPAKKLIQISTENKISEEEIDYTLAHEVDGHVLRMLNAIKQVDPLLQKPFPFYIKTEEGLASYLGDFFSKGGKANLRKHLVRYLAIEVAQRYGFKFVYQYFRDNGFDSKEAFNRTYKIKKGFADTSAPGFHAKDAMYYEGMLAVKNYLTSGGNVKKLYSAKIGIDDIPFVQDTTEVFVPQRLIQIYN